VHGTHATLPAVTPPAYGGQASRQPPLRKCNVSGWAVREASLPIARRDTPLALSKAKRRATPTTTGSQKRIRVVRRSSEAVPAVTPPAYEGQAARQPRPADAQDGFPTPASQPRPCPRAYNSRWVCQHSFCRQNGLAYVPYDGPANNWMNLTGPIPNDRRAPQVIQVLDGPRGLGVARWSGGAGDAKCAVG